MTSSYSAVVTGALDEMDFKTGVGSFGQDMDISVPAQLRFTEPPTQAIRRFHVELLRRGYAPFDSDPARLVGDKEPSGAYYNGEICSKEHYSRMKVAVMRGNVVRLFPHDEWEVEPEELTDIIGALEDGFGAPLEHYPIEQEEDDE